MNTIVTSKEEILKTSRALIQEQGWSAVSIRSVAAACGVSVGSIYNYFDSKAELVSATVESVWREIFHRPEDAAVFQDVQACVIWMYERMAYGYEQYPGFSHCIRSALCGTKRLTASATCSRLGTTCSWGCAQFSSRMPGYGRMPLMSSSRQKNLPRCCFHSCCPLCCGRIMTPVLCWRSCAEPYIDHRLFIPTSVWEF